MARRGAQCSEVQRYCASRCGAVAGWMVAGVLAGLSLALWVAPASAQDCFCTRALSGHFVWPIRGVLSPYSFTAVYEDGQFTVEDANGEPCVVTHRMTLHQPSNCRPELHVAEVECNDPELPLRAEHGNASGRWNVQEFWERYEEPVVEEIRVGDARDLICIYPDRPMRTIWIELYRGWSAVPVLVSIEVDGIRYGTYLGPGWTARDFGSARHGWLFRRHSDRRADAHRTRDHRGVPGWRGSDYRLKSKSTT